MRNVYTVIEVGSREHIVTPVYNRIGTPYDEPNYQGTRQALCGVLKKGENLQQWLKRTGKK